jgi:hypothetical protein
MSLYALPRKEAGEASLGNIFTDLTATPMASPTRRHSARCRNKNLVRIVRHLQLCLTEHLDEDSFGQKGFRALPLTVTGQIPGRGGTMGAWRANLANAHVAHYRQIKAHL